MRSLKEIFFVEKIFETSIDWDTTKPNWHEFRVPLTVKDITVEGLALRGRAIKNYLDRKVLFQLEICPAAGKNIQLSRAEWRPFGTHNNHGIGPEDLRFIDISGSHVHEFLDNYLENINNMRSKNLPIAVPINPDPSSCRSFIDEVGRMFRIKGMESVPLPPAQAILL